MPRIGFEINSQGLEITPGLVAPSVVPQRLLAATLAMVCGSSAQGSSVLLEAAVAAWEAAILRSLFMSKLKIMAAAFAAFGIVAAGTALIAQVPATSKQQSGVTKEAKAFVQPPPLPDPDLEFVSPLLARPAQVSRGADARSNAQLYQNAQVSFGDLMRAEELYNEAKLEASDDPEDGLAVLRKALDEATQHELIAISRHEAARAAQVEVDLATDQRLKAAPTG